ncbi:MAG: hypothetical protein R2912_08745 [Eubacteriales bacterium]
MKVRINNIKQPVSEETSGLPRASSARQEAELASASSSDYSMTRALDARKNRISILLSIVADVGDAAAKRLLARRARHPDVVEPRQLPRQ